MAFIFLYLHNFTFAIVNTKLLLCVSKLNLLRHIYKTFVDEFNLISCPSVDRSCSSTAKCNFKGNNGDCFVYISEQLRD